MQIKVLDIVFENKIKPFEIEAFRGAISRIVGFENTMFHNHINDEKLAYAYPLIHYKTINNQAAFTCIGSGVEEATSFFKQKSWHFEMTGKKIQLKIDTFQLRNCKFQLTDRKISYKLSNWLPLNQTNFIKFNKIVNTIDKIEFLERILVGNILSMAKAINWTITDRIDLSIDEVIDQKTVLFKRNNLLAFDILFSANIELPNQIGLGKGVSHGYGIIKHKKQNLNQS
jgi:hypothetical protein